MKLEDSSMKALSSSWQSGGCELQLVILQDTFWYNRMIFANEQIAAHLPKMEAILRICKLSIWNFAMDRPDAFGDSTQSVGVVADSIHQTI